jgi:hypothetical protein
MNKLIKSEDMDPRLREDEEDNVFYFKKNLVSARISTSNITKVFMHKSSNFVDTIIMRRDCHKNNKVASPHPREGGDPCLHNKKITKYMYDL